jgi:hypothetical protein
MKWVYEIPLDFAEWADGPPIKSSEDVEDSEERAEIEAAFRAQRRMPRHESSDT